MARFTCKYENSLCIDIEVQRENGSPLCMLGTGGKNRELAILPQDFSPEKHLAVFLGYGMGYAYQAFLQKYPNIPVAIIDKETDLLQALSFQPSNNTQYFEETDKDTVLKKITFWQESNNNKALYPIVNPFYQRLDKEFYGYLREQLTASKQYNFWEKAKYNKFQNKTPRLLLISSKYFLFGEVENACNNLGIECKHLQLVNDEMAQSDFIKQLLEIVISFKPDALVTLNHSGIDREGILMDLLNKLELPLISWFVDNPNLVLASYEGLSSPWLHIFTWDKDNIPSLNKKGFNNVYYLPLGTDTNRFNPNNKNIAYPKEWNSDVSFVGNSMISKVQKRWEASNCPNEFYQDFLTISNDFIFSNKKDAHDFILEEAIKKFPAICNYYYQNLNKEEQLAFETGLTWEATRLYRLSCVEQTLDFNPLIVGDDGWQVFFEKENRNWRWHEPIAYYTHLPNFYPHSRINFNCTSMQMKGASNQRILDVPATGSFVLTDYREQMENMFDIGTEIICYKTTNEIPDLIKYYLSHEKERLEIIQKGRERVLKCHTWTHRVAEIIRVMQDFYCAN